MPGHLEPASFRGSPEVLGIQTLQAHNGIVDGILCLYISSRFEMDRNGWLDRDSQIGVRKQCFFFPSCQASVGRLGPLQVSVERNSPKLPELQKAKGMAWWIGTRWAVAKLTESHRQVVKKAVSSTKKCITCFFAEKCLNWLLLTPLADSYEIVSSPDPLKHYFPM